MTHKQPHGLSAAAESQCQIKMSIRPEAGKTAKPTNTNYKKQVDANNWSIKKLYCVPLTFTQSVYNP